MEHPGGANDWGELELPIGLREKQIRDWPDEGGKDSPLAGSAFDGVDSDHPRLHQNSSRI